MFEARTLFFLASWIEASVHSCMPDLTLACIGNPPLRVVRLAEQAGADVEIGARAARGSTANKLRGLKVAGHDNPILLLDADILILGSLRELEDLPEDYAVARASRGIITERYWIEIYGGMGLTVPAAMIMPVEGSEGAPAQPMFPYFNGGVVYSKRNASLAQTWERHLGWLFQRYAGDQHPRRLVRDSDQVGLATAIHELCVGSGHSFSMLPDRFNVRPPHLRSGAFDMESTSILHLIGFFRGLTNNADLATRLEADIEMFAEMFRQGAIQGGNDRHVQADLFQAYMRKLWETSIAPLYGL